MNKITKLILSALPLCALTVLTSCEGSPITIDDAAANQRVMAAAQSMTTGRMDSFEIDVVADVNYNGKVYDQASTLVSDRVLDAAGEIHVKANNLFADDAKASVLTSASLHAEEDSVVLVDVDAAAALYLDAGWLYADLTEIEDILTLAEVDIPEVLTLKTHVGNLATALEIDPDAPAVTPIDMNALLPYVNAIEGIEATELNGELTVVYTVTLEDIVSVYLLVAEQNGEYDPSTLTSEQITQIHDMVMLEISSVIGITKAEFTLGVNAEGYINKLYVDVDVTVTTPSGDVENGTSVTDLEASLHVDISNLNKVVDVVLPDNLDSYTDIDLQ